MRGPAEERGGTMFIGDFRGGLFLCLALSLWPLGLLLFLGFLGLGPLSFVTVDFWPLFPELG
jgi:hypothetical protein